MAIRLLLIENDDEVALPLERSLALAGFAVTRCRDGEQGVAAFSAQPWHVVLCGGLLPRKNGYDVCSAIRALPGGAEVVFVLMSEAFRGSSARREALREGGVDAYFHRPFVVAELVETLQQLARGGRFGPAGAPPPAMPAPPPVPHDEDGDGYGDERGDGRFDDAPARTAPPPLPDEERPARAQAFPKARGPAAARAPFDDLSSGYGLRTATLEAHAPAVDGPVSNHVDVARAMLSVSRARATGILRLEDGGSRMDLAFLRGVPVGGWDNLREHLLGERLWRRGLLTADQMRRLNERIATRGERVAEALLSLGLCDARTALGHIEEQARDRVRRALAWTTGALSFVTGAAAVDKLAVASIDLVEEILWFGLLPVHAPLADRFVTERADRLLERTADFDDGLVAYARLRPTSSLPRALLRPEVTVAEAAGSVPPDERRDLYAVWLAGLVTTDDEGALDARSVARPLRGVEAAQAIVDPEAVQKISEALLRARGRSFYDLLGVDPRAPAAVVEAALRRVRDQVGIEALHDARLGPARAAARELWSILDEAGFVLLDPERRAAYDEDIASTRLAVKAAADFRPEQDFLDGQMSLTLGDASSAREAFERAVAARPQDAEYLAWLGWAKILEGKEPELSGLSDLREAARLAPQAMRPVYFLALAARRGGDVAGARVLLEEAVRRAPEDVEVREALRSLPS